MSFPIICHGCQRTGSVDRVTAGLQCDCGSTDLDLFDGGQKTATWGDQYHNDEKGEYEFPAHLNVPYNIGYSHGQDGRPAAGPPGVSEHGDAYTLGHEHGTRDRNHVIQNETWGRDENNDVRQQPGPEGSRLKPWTSAARSDGGTGWGKSHPSADSNWSDYAGPTPGPNPNIGTKTDADADHVCQICKGTGKTSIGGGGYDESVCRNCHGTGSVKYSGESHGETNDATTSTRPQLGASAARAKVTMPDGTTYFLPMNVNAGRRSADPLGSPEDHIMAGGGYGDRENNTQIRQPADLAQSHGDAPLSLDQASCPDCGHAPTQIVKDKNDDGWWHCPSCGPLANVDKNPEVDPYRPGDNFTPDRSMKRKGKILNRKGGSTGKLLSMTASIQSKNAVTVREALTLAREALISFPEGRD
jgi:hypothetical protein